MMDPRIYRAAFLPAIAAVVVLMFSLERAPEPIEGPVSTPTFEGSATARLARSIATRTPSRAPGSPGDAALAQRVREQFSAIVGGEVATQQFDTEYEGSSVSLQNVLLTLPGRRPEALLVVAARDSAVGQGASTSAASTAVLMQLADDLGNSRREQTIVLASVNGAGSGSEGIDVMVEALPDPLEIEAAIAIVDAGVTAQQPPFVFAGYSGPRSVPAALIGTAAEIATVQFERDADPTGTWDQFARLAFPFGIGEASALTDAGLDAIAVSGSGERPPPPEQATTADLSTATVFAVGSTVLDLLQTLDQRVEPLPAGPAAYVRIGDNLLAGWTLQLLALTLLLPALLAAGDVWLRDRRRSPRVTRRSIPWALERILLPLAALLFAYVLSQVGLIPDPASGYDPSQFPPGLDAPLSFAAIAIAIVLVGLLVRPMRTPLDAEPQTLAAAGGLICGAAVLGIWLSNPFLALLVIPTAHVWLLGARAQGPPRAPLIGLAAALALVPVTAAAIGVASSLSIPAIEAPWHLLLLVTSGQIGVLQSLLWCLLGGGLLACVAAGRVEPPLETLPRPPSVRGPGNHVGPGALGGTPSSLPGR